MIDDEKPDPGRTAAPPEPSPLDQARLLVRGRRFGEMVLRRFPEVFGGTCLFLGLLSILGWMLQFDILVQLRPHYAPMQFNTAVVLVLCGVGLIGGARGIRSVPAATGFAASLLAALVLCQYVFGIDLGIDTLYHEPHITTHTPDPGRMAPNTALGFILVGVALILAFRLPFVAALLGASTFSLAIASLVGYAAGLEPAYVWGNVTWMAPQTAVSLLFLGFGITPWAFQIKQTKGEEPFWWRSIISGTCMLLVSVAIWIALKAENLENIQQRVGLAGHGLRGQIQSTMRSYIVALENLAVHGATVGWSSTDDWKLDAKLTVGTFAGFETLEWLDSEFQPRVLTSPDKHPAPQTLSEEDEQLRVAALKLAKSSLQPVVIGPFDSGAERTFRVIIPLAAFKHPEAYLSGVFSAEDALGLLVNDVAPGYAVDVRCLGSTVFHSGRPFAETEPRPWARSLLVDLGGPITWNLVIAPSPRLLSTLDSELPEVALVAGLALAALLVLTVRFGELATIKARSFEQAVKERTHELRLQSKKLEEADRRKDQFIAMLGHELRNPLGSIRTAIEVMHLEPQSERMDSSMQRIVTRQIEHVARLLDDLLDISRIERGLISVTLEPLDLAKGASAAADAVRTRASGAGLTLRTDFPSEPVWVRVDPVRLGQVFHNLLGNAIKFTDPGGTVDLRVSSGSKSNYAAVSVADTGCGLRSDEKNRIFDPFYQSEDARTRRAGGLGLGLPLVKGIIEAMGGTISVFSEGPGRGTEFVFRLPIAAADERPEVDAPPEETQSSGTRVLVVDDHLDSAASLAQFLTVSQYEVAVANDGYEALDKYRTFRPEAVICDLDLPGMTGYDVARAIRRDSRNSEVLLVALTGLGDVETLRRAREAGFTTHLLKPADTKLIRRVLASATISGTDEEAGSH